MSTGISPGYPVRVEGRLDPGLSRWLWLVKWVLVIPHYIVLAFLWLAFAVLSVVAFFAILFTGRYPRGIFDFNVGVLRWTWRVGFYAFGTNGTDRYPPFSLGADDYPARLEIDYPATLSRGLVLVKWWLLAIPHYIVVGLFVGGGTWFAWQIGEEAALYGGGLVGVLVLIAVIALLFSGRYPQGIFDVVLGMNRWALRVAAYAGLMTDRYPPFRLDLGGHDPGSVVVAPEPPAAEAVAGAEPPAATAPAPWTTGRIALVVGGSLLALIAAGLLAAGVGAIVVDQTSRDDQGYVMTPRSALTTGTYALVSEQVDIDYAGVEVVRDLLGSFKLETDSASPVFVGIGPAAAVDAYLAGVPYAEVDDFAGGSGTAVAGGDAPAAAADQSFWVAAQTGAGETALRWQPGEGDWRAVVMNADGSAGVTAEVSVGAQVHDLLGIGIGVALAGAALLGIAGLLIYLAARRSAA